MSRLRFAAQMLIQRHKLPAVPTTLTRAISTSASKPNFGNREMPLSGEPVHVAATQFLSEPEVVENSNKQEKSGDATANRSQPTIKEDTLPAVTIVDVNGGYGRMDFEERMEHMDRVDRINNEKLPSNIATKLVLPLIKEIPTVVDIDAYGDDMMYEDKPEKQTQSELAAAGNDDVGRSLMPIANDKPHTPTREREEAKEFMVKAIALPTNAISGENLELVVPEKSISAGNETAVKERICVAPVDIDAFPMEEEVEKKHGTVDIDTFGDNERRQLPPIPKVRNNVFKFKGITIIMPKRMLRDSTYRYRLDPQDMDKPDDMQICTFEK
ncbi:PREDICTED: uncharacterized protein LOC108361259 [Rhagoletis zephyria]|uniref:uncharacterized protein LOC108361259 n=1 Tax=Rhagoletis zephyria TaxID=28612 RepID=UPI0008115DB0|nr:PREDICTED: uncharacterized protein LOC108361259 [Rhagoletis zephyria]